MATQRVFQDRTLATKWALQIEDGQATWASTGLAAEAEPIVEDQVTAANHWKVFFDDGQIGWESTATVQDDNVTLTDTVTAQDWRLRVGDGQLFWEVVVAAGTFLFKAINRGLEEGVLVGLR